VYDALSSAKGQYLVPRKLSAARPAVRSHHTVACVGRRVKTS